MNPLKRNLKLYPWYVGLFHAYFWLPVYFLFFNSQLELSDVLYLEAIYFASVVVIEVPSGWFSDLFGRRRTLITASVFLCISYILFLIADSFFRSESPRSSSPQALRLIVEPIQVSCLKQRRLWISRINIRNLKQGLSNSVFSALQLQAFLAGLLRSLTIEVRMCCHCSEVLAYLSLRFGLPSLCRKNTKTVLDLQDKSQHVSVC